MNLKNLLLVACMLVAANNPLKAQYTQNAASSSLDDPKMNFVKLNLTGIIFKNYSLQYERVLNKTFSVAASFRTMPKTSVPLKNLLLKAIDDDQETKDAIEALRVSNFAFTPEVRIYLGKGYGRGFYVAPFYRYAKFKADNVRVTFQNSANQDNVISLGGDVTANTGGLMFGAQWALGKHVALDWWILGAHYGSGKGTLAGIAAKPLSASEQASLRNELDNLELPLSDISYTVTANGATVYIDGPWAGIRGGITLGVKF